MKKSLSRRQFHRTAVAAGVGIGLTRGHVMAQSKKTIRLGGPVFEAFEDPADWIKALRKLGYSAALSPVKASDSTERKQAFINAARETNIIMAEVGAWSNPISPNNEERQKAIDKNIRQLALADEIGANCCVNIAGSRSDKWDGPHPDNISSETFDLVVETTRHIIDSVKPARTFYTLEAMPWVLPDSPDSYLRLLKAIDRDRFAVHLDPVNMINSPRRYYDTGGFIRECFKKLGPYIKNCHAKDIRLTDQLTTHLNEVIPGQGGLAYDVYLTELSKLPPDVGLVIEHLQTPQEYKQAAKYIRSVGKKQKLDFIKPL